MQSLQEQLDHYASHHTKFSTKLTHMVGIPMIILGLMILFSWISLDIFGRYTIAVSWLLIIASIIYYYLLDKKVALQMGLIFIIVNAITSYLSGPAPTKASLIAFVILFIGGWVIQFVGHGFEKNRPAFMDSALQILIAPVFIFREITEKLGIGS